MDIKPVQVLIVDDDKVSRRMLNLAVEEYALFPHHIKTVCDGGEAKEQLELITPDLVITDLFMPVINGFDLTIYLKSLKHPPFVIVVSGLPSNELELAERLGPDVVVNKSNVLDGIADALSVFKTQHYPKGSPPNS